MKGKNRRLIRSKLSLFFTLQLFLVTTIALSPCLEYSSGSVASINYFIISQGLTDETKIECTEPWQIVFPGDTVSFGLKVKNLGSRFDSYFITIENPSLPENWTANFYANNKKVKEIGIGAGQSLNLALSVEVPRDASSGDYNFRVNLIGQYSNTTQSLTITVEEILRKIEMTCPFNSQTIFTGQSASYLIKIMNEGKQAEKVFLEVNVSAAMIRWEISFSQKQLTLNANDGQWVTLSVKSPDIVKEGNYAIEAMATTEDGEAKASLQVTTKIIAEYLLEIAGIQPINPQVYSGDKIEIIVTVRNVGLSPVSKVKLNVNSTAISNILVTPIDVSAIESKANANFYIRISPNIGSTTGDYLISIQAVSDETQSSVRVFAVSVVSAIPWFWITISLTVIATALAVIAVQRAVSKYGISIRRRK